ncbi:unnamed protein product [Gongylonema pulchrum]|uniref:MKRN2 opposite strand protein n=1 Tax=Gongylonema pulchrum TaxID=637853 RepID=A0A183EFR3_9BILA|nr:unnamed protein product [Gongylonema pulchrum]
MSEDTSSSLSNPSRYCINSDDDKEEKLLDGSQCIFMLDVNTNRKVYSGAMHWNNIHMEFQTADRANNSLVALARGRLCKLPNNHTLEEDKCYRYVSSTDYFVLCCCYSNPENCSFGNEEKSLKLKNRETWSQVLKVRNPAVHAEIHDNRLKETDIIWDYRHFIYSESTEDDLGTI